MYKRILVPLDGSPVAECVIPHIIAIAKSYKTEVELIGVAEPLDIPTRGNIALSEDDIKQIDSEIRKDLHNYLDSVKGQLVNSQIQVHITVLSGKAADSLISYAENNDIDLIIMATHGRSGINRWFWGSVAEKVLRAVNIPVLLIKTISCKDDA
ncbi:MAG: universal stress protein [Dehalococcoidia bacterium]|nr:MAG: universal stress protein [Dehalococcoidia bacterium]